MYKGIQELEEGNTLGDHYILHIGCGGYLRIVDRRPTEHELECLKCLKHFIVAYSQQGNGG